MTDDDLAMQGARSLTATVVITQDNQGPVSI